MGPNTPPKRGETNPGRTRIAAGETKRLPRVGPAPTLGEWVNALLCAALFGVVFLGALL